MTQRNVALAPITTADIIRHFKEVPRYGGPRYELLRDAAAIVVGIPQHQVHLDKVYACIDPHHEHGCGTVACAMGWLSLHPGFNALGLTCEPVAGWADRLLHLCDTEHAQWFREGGVSYASAATALFNISYDTAEKLFGPIGMNPNDRNWAGRLPHGKIFWRRVEQFIAECS